MRQSIITFLFIGFSSLLEAQNYSVPMESPRHRIEHQFSVSNISVDYGRPAVKGRTIFGGLVPYNKVWRAGANSSTKLSIGQTVHFGGKKLKPGTYGLFIIPNQNEWTVIINKDSQSWGAYSFDEKQNVLEVKLPVENMKTLTEWLTIDIIPVNRNEIKMTIAWEYSRVSIPITVSNPTLNQKIEEKILEIRKMERESDKG